MKGVIFLKLLITKKRSSEILENRRGFFQNLFRMLSENIFFPKYLPRPNICDPNFPPNICDPHFCPPIFMTSLRRRL